MGEDGDLFQDRRSQRWRTRGRGSKGSGYENPGRRTNVRSRAHRSWPTVGASQCICPNCGQFKAGASRLPLLNWTSGLWEDSVGVWSRLAVRADYNDEDHGQHDRVLSDVLALIVRPESAEEWWHLTISFMLDSAASYKACQSGDDSRKLESRLPEGCIGYWLGSSLEQTLDRVANRAQTLWDKCR